MNNSVVFEHQGKTGRHKFCTEMNNHRGNSTPQKRSKISKNKIEFNDEFDDILSDNGEPQSDNNFSNPYPSRLIELMYRLDYSILCSFRKFKHKLKYPSLDIAFEELEIESFRNIILRNNNKSIYVKIKNIKYPKNEKINFSKLFGDKRIFPIDVYFDNFVKYHLNKPKSSLNSVEFLVILTNSNFDLTEENKFKKIRSTSFYPFKFEKNNTPELDILKDCLTPDDENSVKNFYQFSKEKKSKEEFFKRLKISPGLKKKLEEKKLILEKLKEDFFQKLLFLVKQPNRDELHINVKNEIRDENRYVELRSIVLREILGPEKKQKRSPAKPEIMYDYNLLLVLLHDMYLHSDIISINFESKIYYSGTISFKDEFNNSIHIRTQHENATIDYCSLFFPKNNKKAFLKHFYHLYQKLSEKNVKYLIIYTNADLALTEGKKLRSLSEIKNGQFFTLKFDKIDTDQNEYKILKDFLPINFNDLYRFSSDEYTRTKLPTLLNFPTSLSTRKFSKPIEPKTMLEFLDKLLFAVNQPDKEMLNNVIKSEIYESDVPYNFNELHEIALRWAESENSGPITKAIMEKFLGDIKNDKFSSEDKLQITGREKEFQFVKSVVSKVGSYAFHQLFKFLINEEGRKYLEIFENNGTNLSNISSILHGIKKDALNVFLNLCNLWFDKDGNKLECLENLEQEGITIGRLSSILNGSRHEAPEAFEKLYKLWFDENGIKTKYLQTLEENNVDLKRMCSILAGAGAKVAIAFENLYNLWFTENGEKTEYLLHFELNGVNLLRVSSLLNLSGFKAAWAFENLCNLWFDKDGKKTRYLTTLAERGINLSYICSILHHSGANAPKIFKDLYHLWFDQEGNKTNYLINLDKHEIKMLSVAAILRGAGKTAPRAFIDLYNIWFDEFGEPKECLLNLKNEGLTVSVVARMMDGSGANASSTFMSLYHLWFDQEGNGTKYLKILNRHGISINIISIILRRAGHNAHNIFKQFYEILFDNDGNKTKYLQSLHNEGVSFKQFADMLRGSGIHTVKCYKNLYEIIFGEKGVGKKRLSILRKNGIKLSNVCHILKGSQGFGAVKTFEDFFDFFQNHHLKHFTKDRGDIKGFTIRNLTTILNGSGFKAKEALEKFHKVCFNQNGTRTKLLDDFYKVGFTSHGLSCLLVATGANAAFALKKLHRVFFDKKSKILKNFFRAGFRPYNLCTLLAFVPDNAEKFHNFCFKNRKTKKSLKKLINGGFGPNLLSYIFIGSKELLSSALIRFSDICFYDDGNRTQLLKNFRKDGFKLYDLSLILSKSASNAAKTLIEFHNLWFGDDRNYFKRLIGRKRNSVFKANDMAKILYGGGRNLCAKFKRLIKLCFDENGKKTKYFRKLLKGSKFNMIKVLNETVRKQNDVTVIDIDNVDKDLDNDCSEKDFDSDCSDKDYCGSSDNDVDCDGLNHDVDCDYSNIDVDYPTSRMNNLYSHKAVDGDCLDKDLVNDCIDKDLVSDYTEKDLVRDCTDKNLVDDYTEKDLVSDSIDKDLVDDYTEKDLVRDCTDKNLVDDYTEKDLVSDSINKDLVDDYTEKDLVRDCTDKNLVDDYTEKDLVSDSIDKDLVSDSIDKDLVSDSIDKDLVDDYTEKDLVSDRSVKDEDNDNSDSIKDDDGSDHAIDNFSIDPLTDEDDDDSDNMCEDINDIIKRLDMDGIDSDIDILSIGSDIDIYNIDSDDAFDEALDAAEGLMGLDIDDIDLDDTDESSIYFDVGGKKRFLQTEHKGKKKMKTVYC